VSVVDDERTYSREEVVEEIMGELDPLREASPPEEVRMFVDYRVELIGRLKYQPSTASKRTAQNLKKRFDALIEALAATDDIYIEGRAYLGPLPTRYDADGWAHDPPQRSIFDQGGLAYPLRQFGWVHLDRRDLLECLKDVQRGLDGYNKSASEMTWFKAHCADAANQLVAMFSEREPTTYDDGPMRKIAELIYGLYTGDYNADLRRACYGTVKTTKKNRARLAAETGPEFEFPFGDEPE
jgi:hypothetical protein